MSSQSLFEGSSGPRKLKTVPHPLSKAAAPATKTTPTTRLATNATLQTEEGAQYSTGVPGQEKPFGGRGYGFLPARAVALCATATRVAPGPRRHRISSSI